MAGRTEVVSGRDPRTDVPVYVERDEPDGLLSHPLIIACLLLSVDLMIVSSYRVESAFALLRYTGPLPVLVGTLINVTSITAPLAAGLFLLCSALLALVGRRSSSRSSFLLAVLMGLATLVITPKALLKQYALGPEEPRGVDIGPVLLLTLGVTLILLFAVGMAAKRHPVTREWLRSDGPQPLEPVTDAGVDIGGKADIAGPEVMSGPPEAAQREVPAEAAPSAGVTADDAPTEVRGVHADRSDRVDAESDAMRDSLGSQFLGLWLRWCLSVCSRLLRPFEPTLSGTRVFWLQTVSSAMAGALGAVVFAVVVQWCEVTWSRLDEPVASQRDALSATLTRVWLPPEIIEYQIGDASQPSAVLVGYVLDIDDAGRWMSVLDEKTRRVVVLDVRTVIRRTSCLLDSVDRRPVLSLVPLESQVDGPLCGEGTSSDDNEVG